MKRKPRKFRPKTFLKGSVSLYHGDCLAVLKTMADASVDSVVTDPPYHLTSIVKRFGSQNAAPAKAGKTGAFKRASAGFMGKQWDGGDIAFRTELWAEVLRVLKPGGHLCAFGGTRTFARMSVAIEDSGFEIRDTLMWLYGSGFPKSHDAAQSIEKLLTTGKSRRPDRDLGGLPRNRFSGSVEGTLIANTGGKLPLTTTQAKKYEGWGTALKPAVEPIVLARKPLIGTVAENVLAHGTGALNIDGCRVEAPEGVLRMEYFETGSTRGYDGGLKGGKALEKHTQGRWPANVIHDGSKEVVEAFPDVHGAGHARSGKFGGEYDASSYNMGGIREMGRFGDEGSAARFFYTAKADADDRIGSKHPTVKPVDLKQWLVRLVTPKDGIVLDPFAGTGTTGEAAWLEGMRAILIEREKEYITDIHRRMKLALSGPDERARESIKAKIGGKPIDLGPLFGGKEE